jgi:hypothetical protein
MAIPSTERTALWAPSAPTRKPARCACACPAGPRSTAVTPSSSWSKVTSSVPNRTRAAG